LLLPCHEDENSNYLIEKIKEYAKDKPVDSFRDCVLVAVVEEAREKLVTQQRLIEAEKRLNGFKADLEKLSIKVEIDIRQGNLIHETLDAAYEWDITAIAIASKTQSRLLEWTVPSLAQEVLHYSWFPILFFSPKK
jgi:nucleotide-binding universal stress UspA family protein